jgi:thioredoxin 1
MASANVKEFTTENWEAEVVKSDKPVLVDFWATWCGPCKMLLPTIDKLAEQFAGKVKVGKLNVDDQADVAVRYNITSIPRVLIFNGSDQPVDTVTGVAPLANFVAMLNRVLEQAPVKK